VVVVDVGVDGVVCSGRERQKKGQPEAAVLAQPAQQVSARRARLGPVVMPVMVDVDVLVNGER
jgi:hypothetical protein